MPRVCRPITRRKAPYRQGRVLSAPVHSEGILLTTSRLYLWTAQLAVLNKHLYFVDTSKTFRVSLAKIVAFEPFTERHRDTKRDAPRQDRRHLKREMAGLPITSFKTQLI